MAVRNGNKASSGNFYLTDHYEAATLSEDHAEGHRLSCDESLASLQIAPLPLATRHDMEIRNYLSEYAGDPVLRWGRAAVKKLEAGGRASVCVPKRRANLPNLVGSIITLIIFVS